jgi:hypothetical protein
MVTKNFQSPLDDEGMSDVFGKPSLSKISVVTKKLTFFLVDIQGYPHYRMMIAKF